MFIMQVTTESQNEYIKRLRVNVTKNQVKFGFGGRSGKIDFSLLSSTSFPGSLFSSSLGRWNKDPGRGWSRDHL